MGIGICTACIDHGVVQIGRLATRTPLTVLVDGLTAISAAQTTFSTRATPTGTEVIVTRVQGLRTRSGSARGIQIDQNLDISMIGSIERQGILAFELDHQVTVKLDRIEGVLGLLEPKRISRGRSPTVGYDGPRARTARAVTPSGGRRIESERSVIEIDLVFRHEGIGRVRPIRSPSNLTRRPGNNRFCL